MVQVTPTIVVRTEPIAGSWTRFRVIVEKDGKPIPWTGETDDPHAAELDTAARVRSLCGLPPLGGLDDGGPRMWGLVAAGLTSPLFWAAVVGAILFR